MPNATCFLIAYGLVWLAELARFASKSESAQRWSTRATLGMFVLAFITHSLYLVDRVAVAWGVGERFQPFGTWQEWGILAAWTVAIAFALMLWRRSDKQIGLFVLPLILALIGVSVAIPAATPIAANNASTASFWRLLHSVAMLIGTMLVTLGFAVATMYLVHAWKLKHKVPARGTIRLPSLEYLQSMGRNCILGSAAAVGFGVISGAIMSFTRDGQIAWTDRGIIFTGGLFLWLCFAAVAQWVSSNRGRGEWTAAMSILSFLIVVVVLAMVVTAPHGTSPSMSPDAVSGLNRVQWMVQGKGWGVSE